MGFFNEEGDYWWWFMSSVDVNVNCLILLELNNLVWCEDMLCLIVGVIGCQQCGYWSIIMVNVWGSLVLEKFVCKFEFEFVIGIICVMLEQNGISVVIQSLVWSGVVNGGKLQLFWLEGNVQGGSVCLV